MQQCKRHHEDRNTYHQAAPYFVHSSVFNPSPPFHLYRDIGFVGAAAGVVTSKSVIYWKGKHLTAIFFALFVTPCVCVHCTELKRSSVCKRNNNNPFGIVKLGAEEQLVLSVILSFLSVCVCMSMTMRCEYHFMNARKKSWKGWWWSVEIGDDELGKSKRTSDFKKNVEAL